MILFSKSCSCLEVFVVFDIQQYSFITLFTYRDDDEEESMDIAGINLKVTLFISIISNTLSLPLLS